MPISLYDIFVSEEFQEYQYCFVVDSFRLTDIMEKKGT